MNLELSRYIEGDLDDIADFIAQDSPLRAVSFIRAIRSKFLVIQSNPLHYQLRLDIGEDARLVSVGHYTILFRVVDTQTVRIERVVYGARDLPEVLDAP